MLIDGYWVVLKYRDQEFDYRAGSSDYFHLCESGGSDPYEYH
jgi:hypothetical protein